MRKYNTKKNQYGLSTFIENAKSHGFSEALKKDRSVLVNKSPTLSTLVKAHNRGVELMEDRNSHYDSAMAKSKTPIGKMSFRVFRKPMRFLNNMDYPFGFLDGLSGIK
jgi:hypothetical protein